MREKERIHKNTAYNMRFGAMAAEVRNNGSAKLKEPCAAERLVEAATASSRCLVVGKPSGSANLTKED